MLAYAANRPRTGARQSSPNAMLVVIAVHVGFVAAIMSARMDLPDRIMRTPIEVDLISPPPPPPPHKMQQPRAEPRQAPQLSQPEVRLPPIETPADRADSSTKLPNIGDLLGPGTQPEPRVEPRPTPLPAPTQARLLTPASELKPPYPESKLLTGEEAVLRLRLTISEQGRVIAVESVGRADRAFLDAARRHLLQHWRYRPATEGGQAVASVVTITLRFQLD